METPFQRRRDLKRTPAFSCLLFIAVSVIAASFTATSGSQTTQVLSPSQYLGKQIGADGVLANYNEIWKYYSYVDSVSDWIKVLDLGKTTLGNNFLMAVASNPTNLENLDRHLEISKALRDARGISPEEAAALAREGKVILLDMSAIHSDEIAATQMTLELAYKIASDDESIVPYLKDVILLIMPSVNPDGHNMYVEYYGKWKGTAYDGGWMPWLYHPYAGHDNNRDWYMFNLAETKMVSKVMYETWIPQVILDHHQMWMTGARIFVPPYADPVNPNLDPVLWREIELIGSTIHLKMQERGLSGVIHSASFPGWWEGASVMTPLWHNVASLLTETASARIATPIYVDPSELGAWGTGFPKYTRLSNFPDPWPGGWWRLRDIMNYELASIEGGLEACSKNKETILLNFYKMAAAGIEKGKTEKPYAYVIPYSDDSRVLDHFTLTRMIQRLMLGGVEIHRALAAFVVDGRTMPKGSYVIFLAQPYRAYAKDMLERQHYPVIRIAPEARPLEPYDATAWTMPLKMGVETIEVEAPFEAETQRVEKVESPARTIPGTSDTSGSRAPGAYPVGYLAVSRSSLGSFTFVNRALKSHLGLFAATDTLEAITNPARAHGQAILPGTILVDLGKDPDATASKVQELTAGLGLTFDTVRITRPSTLKPIKPFRLGVYKSYLEGDPAGWLKYVLDDFEFEYTYLKNDDIKKGHLARSFDVIIFHDIDATSIKDGKPGGWGAEFFEPLPPQYSGGIGDDGIKALTAFLEEGGVIIATAASCEFAMKEFDLKVKNVLKEVPEKTFSCPGSVLKLAVNPASEIGYGMKAETPCLFFYSAAFSTQVPYGKFAREIVARYADTDLLMSGWITGEDMIMGKPVVVKMGYGKGTVILSGFDPIHRAQTYSTYKILFNSILLGAVRE